jgi:hypothetical protein
MRGSDSALNKRSVTGPLSVCGFNTRQSLSPSKQQGESLLPCRFLGQNRFSS